MKIRNGFVSNSSSSSFIIIADEQCNSYSRDENPVLVPQPGSKIKFGWEFENTHDVDGKINFAVMQALYVKRDDWIDMIHKVVKDHSGHDLNIQLEVDDWGSEYNGCIDHQSSSLENENIHIFDSEDKLKSFLFNINSYIEGGNDNV